LELLPAAAVRRAEAPTPALRQRVQVNMEATSAPQVALRPATDASPTTAAYSAAVVTPAQ
jgi:hypothetical protein